MRRSMALILTAALLGGSSPVLAAEGGTGSAVGRVTVLRKGMPSTAEPTWKVRFTAQDGKSDPVEVPLKEGVYETPELPVGAYQIQVVDAFGQVVGAPQPVVLTEGAIRADLRLELTKDSGGAGATGDKKSTWKVVAIVAGAAAVLALVAGGGDDDDPASPAN